MRDNPNYIGECDYENYVIYVFKLPEELVELKYTMLRDKYSEISEDFKQIIINFIFNHYGAFDASIIQQILYKDAEFRDNLAESLNVKLPLNAKLSSVIDIEKELFSNYVEQNKTIKDENKDQKSREWNPWATANKG